MGGLGSGSWYRHSTRWTTSDIRALDIRRLHKKKLLESRRVFGWSWTRNGEEIASIGIQVEEGYVTLFYTHTPREGKPQEIKDRVAVDWTACHYGGKRPWFLCPLCGKRVLILYSGVHFYCRHCHKLPYKSQSEDKMSRLIRRKFKLKNRLGGEDWWRKPKGMHQTTYDRLRGEYKHYEAAADYALYKKCKRLL